MNRHLKNKSRFTQAKLQELTGKVPPNDAELEQAVLNTLLMNPNHLGQCVMILETADVFFDAQHAAVYGALASLYDAGDVVVPIAVLTKLSKQEAEGNDVPADWRTVLERLMNFKPLAANMYMPQGVFTHCYVLRELYLKREQIRIGYEMVARNYDRATDALDNVAASETDISRLALSHAGSSYQPIARFVGESFEAIAAGCKSTVDFTGVPTGFSYLNELTGGWQPGDLVILAARPSVGKTAFAVQLAWQAATDALQPVPAALFSLEMGGMQLVRRLLANVAGVEHDAILRPKKLSPLLHQRLTDAGKRISDAPVYLDETPGLSLHALKAKLRRLVLKDGVGLAIIDYLQLMNCNLGNSETREQEVSKISRELKALAKELNIPIIALSQLNRSVEHTARPPRLSDLRESGAIEQDADLVMFLSRKTELSPATASSGYCKEILLDIAKHRNGATDEMTLYFEGKYQRFNETIRQFDN